MPTNVPQDVDEYISAAPEAAQPKLKELREVILAAAPGAEEGISYAMPTYTYRGLLMHFAGYNRHVGVYGASDSVRHVRELEKYMAERGTLRFPLGEPLPVALIRRLIEARVKDNESDDRVTAP